MTGEQEVYAHEILREALTRGRLSGDDFAKYKRRLMQKGVSPDEADYTLRTFSECVTFNRQLGMKPDKQALKRYLAMANGDPEQLHIICPLHGIRTNAPWHRQLSDAANVEGWTVRQDRWYYGWFRTIWFALPITRNAMIPWLRKQYDLEKNDVGIAFGDDHLPSVVAHSFGTYILGYTLLRFRFIRFNKVILCGSILPVDFPWDKIIERGQVQAVRNEYGIRDPWVKRVRGYIGETGPSGHVGFTCRHPRLVQEEFDYNHGDYFGRDHMLAEWFPFLDSSYPIIKGVKEGVIRAPKGNAPFGLYFGLATLAFMIWAAIYIFWNWSGLKQGSWWFIGVPLLLLVVIDIWLFVFYSKPPK